jgi:hypothetical protein
LFERLEGHADLTVVDAQVAVATAVDRSRHDTLYLLRDHPDIGGLGAVIGKTVEAEPVLHDSQQEDMVLELNIGTAPAATAPATTTTTSAPAHARAATTSGHTSAAATATLHRAAATRGHARHAGMSTL